MPRKVTGEKLEKVVSTKISAEDFMLLEKYARIRYNENMLKLPTVSHMLRMLVGLWAKQTRQRENKTA